MKVGKRVTLLGTVVSFVWQPEKGDKLKVERFSTRSKKTKKYLCCNGKGTNLWLLPAAKSQEIDVPRGYEREKALYLEWTRNHEVDSAFEIFCTPQTLAYRGTILEIVYESDKFSRPGNQIRYVHEYESDPLPRIYSDKPNKPHVWGVRNRGNTLVTELGLIG